MKKDIDSSKSGLYALGYIKNESTYLSDINRLSNTVVDASTLDTQIMDSYHNDRVLCYQYKDTGEPTALPFDEAKTYQYAVDTGYLATNTNPSYPDESIYACFTRDNDNRWSGVKFFTQYKLENFLNSYRFGYINFRTYVDANTFISNLESTLLPGEVWKFQANSNLYRPKTVYDVLQSYLQHVFDKLVNEYTVPDGKNKGKIVFSSDDNYALFNTGLLDKFAHDVYLVGSVYNKRPDGTFTFSNPLVAPGKVDLMRNFNFTRDSLNPFPGVVEFFNDIDEIIYNADTEIDLSPEKLRHIIVDGAARGRFSKKHTELYEKNDLASLASTLELAIENAQKIAKRNYKYVVPQYRSAKYGSPSTIQFLMPIFMDSQYGQKPDFALVLNEEDVGGEKFYTPETILELPWAYNNARVICKPEDTWLNPSLIESPAELPPDEEGDTDFS